MPKEKKGAIKTGLRRSIVAKAGHRKPPAARQGGHLTSPEQRAAGRERANFRKTVERLSRD